MNGTTDEARRSTDERERADTHALRVDDQACGSRDLQEAHQQVDAEEDPEDEADGLEVV